MTPRLSDLEGCFEGVIPSIVATASVDGTPNISYLSHVVKIDDDHLGLSNQFFSKTAANLRENPQAALLLVDARDGAQFRVDMSFVESLAGGSAFDRVKSNLDATSAQVGMAGIFRLRSIDVYRVQAVTAVPSPVDAASRAAAPPRRDRLKDVAGVVEAIAGQTDADAVVEALLDGFAVCCGRESSLVLLKDPTRGVLTTVASRGYDRAGIGSEVPLGEGLIGSAAAQARPVRVSDMSRVRRLVAAVSDSLAEENLTRTIPLPGMVDARSQIAVPLIAQGTVRGVLFAESRASLAFTVEDEAALSVIARQAAAALVLAEVLSEEAAAADGPHPVRTSQGRPVRVTHHRFDDSVFIDDEYVIKGVPGRLLMFMLGAYHREGRCEFTNRELRLAPAIRLPDIKDNLETRLLLLRRRLEEKASPVQLLRIGRGRIALIVSGNLVLSSHE